MDYLDFEIRVDEIPDGEDYVVRVERAPALEPGQASPEAAMAFPFDEDTLHAHLEQLKAALARSTSTMVRRPAFRDMEPEEPEDQLSVRTFGQILFDAVLSDEVLACYRSSRDLANAEGKGLRLRLHIEAPKLAMLPWEYLYEEERKTFVCLSTETPVVRYLRIAGTKPPDPHPVEPPLRILGMVASPSVDTPLAPLNVEKEKQRIEETLRPLAGRITLEWLEGQTWQHLQDAMRRGPWHAFHFIGHGGFDIESDQGVVVFAKEDGREHRLPAPKLATLLVDHPPLRLVVLNACQGAQSSADDIFSSTASTLVLGGIPAVVAMQYKISDRAAIEFSRNFYAALADGYPVDAAMSEARKSVNLSMDYTVEWGTPVLHMQSSDGRLFDLRTVRPPPAEPSPAATVEVEAPGRPPASQPVAPSRAAPAAARAPQSWGRKVLLWGVGLVLGALAVLFLLNETLFTAEDEAAERLVAQNGISYVYDSEMDRLARTVLKQDRSRQRDADSVSVRLLPMAPGERDVLTLEVRPGLQYKIYGQCGGGCQELELGAYENADAEEADQLLGPNARDRGDNPLIILPAQPSAARYKVRVTMDECTAGAECLAAYSVYSRPGPVTEASPDSRLP